MRARFSWFPDPFSWWSDSLFGSSFCHMLSRWSSSSNKLPFYSGIGWFDIHARCRHAFSLSVDNTLVNMSNLLSPVWIFTGAKSLSSTLSLNQWYLRWICFILGWQAAFLARWMALWLLQCSWNCSYIIPSSLMKSLIYMIYTSTTTIYSASVVDRAITFCNLDCHETTPPA